ncbi:hypothetical protein H1C71_012693 [Ictidomys tridecemlineatus]|nr:hypothetical protein H1C71_012693 [Ictidomys tridecemlineatus]
MRLWLVFKLFFSLLSYYLMINNQLNIFEYCNFTFTINFKLSAPRRIYSQLSLQSCSTYVPIESHHSVELFQKQLVWFFPCNCANVMALNQGSQAKLDTCLFL